LKTLTLCSNNVYKYITNSDFVSSGFV
jgi:hypothetical protein